MHKDFGDWYRPAGVELKQDTLNVRWNGVQAAADAVDADGIVALLRLFAVPNSNDEQLGVDLRDAMKQADTSFPGRGNAQEMRVLAGAVLRTVLESPGSWADLVAYGLTCSTFGQRQSRVSVPEHVASARRYLSTRAQSLRDVEELRELEDVGDLDAPRPFTKERYLVHMQPMTKGDHASPQITESLFKVFDDVVQDLSGWAKNITASANTQRQSLSVYNEELSYLSWLQVSHSRELSVPFANLEARATLMLPFELAAITKIIPAPTHAPLFLMQAFKLAGQVIDSKVSIAEAINALPHDWRESQSKVGSQFNLHDLCPISGAISSSLSTEGATEWLPVFRKASGFAPDEPHFALHLAHQFFHERMFLRCVRGRSNG